MKLFKILSSSIFLFVASSCMNGLLPMELTSSLDNSFDFNSPSKLLQSIKNLQEKKYSAQKIATVLKQSLKGKGQNLNHITECIHTNKLSCFVNILYFLDKTCDVNTVSIILTSFDTEQDACNFIIETNYLERLWQEDCQQCAIPILKLLQKNGALINLETLMIPIDKMLTEKKKKFTSSWSCCKSIPDDEISDEVVLLELIKELRSGWNPAAGIFIPKSKIS